MNDLDKPFSWGRVIDDLKMGPYTLRAFNPTAYENGRCTNTVDIAKVHYHGYINGKDCHESWLTLEDAMIGIIVRGFIGPNCSSVARHFMHGLRAMSEAYSKKWTK